jgi:low affinity Fe/Cu permease
METGKFLVIAGVVIFVLGLVFMMSNKLPIGRLPGDLRFGGDHFRIYIPIATCVLLSIIITVIVNFFSRK